MNRTDCFSFPSPFASPESQVGKVLPRDLASSRARPYGEAKVEVILSKTQRRRILACRRNSFLKHRLFLLASRTASVAAIGCFTVPAKEEKDLFLFIAMLGDETPPFFHLSYDPERDFLKFHELSFQFFKWVPATILYSNSEFVELPIKQLSQAGDFYRFTPVAVSADSIPRLRKLYDEVFTHFFEEKPARTKSSLRSFNQRIESWSRTRFSGNRDEKSPGKTGAEKVKCSSLT